MDRRRFSFIKLAGALVVVVGAPLLVSEAARHYPTVAGLRPSVPLSMVRPVSVPAPSGLQLMGDEAARRAVVIEALPIPYVSVTLENVNTEEVATFQFSPDGRPRPEHAPLIQSFFRCRRTGRQKPIAAGVLAVVLDVNKRWPGRVIEIISGYRAPPYGAPHSKHFRGHAIDLRVRGVKTTQVRDFIWREHRGVGVGHYHGENFVHVDWRPGETDTAWSARGEDSPLDYRPRWARKLRHTRRPDHGNVASALTVASASVRAM